jgi:GNAT superfamily N-acetyltransferase
MIRFEPLGEQHNVSSFHSRFTFLDDYLKQDALNEARQGIAKTFVAIDSLPEEGEEIVGFFTLACTAQYIPAVRDDAEERYLYPAELKYLARDYSRYGQGIGDALLIEAIRCVNFAANYIGLPGLFLYASSEGAALYERFGFLRLHPDKREYYLPIADIRMIVEGDTDEGEIGE